MLKHYTVTPLPFTQPTPQSVWRPHQPHQPQPQYPINPYPNVHNSKRSTVRTTARTTSGTTTSTTTPRPSEISTQGITTSGSVEADKSTEETEETEETEDYETGLWVDVPTQPESPSSSSGLERQVQRLRAHYLKMGVPQDYLTNQMIWKLMQARGAQSDNDGFHF